MQKPNREHISDALIRRALTRQLIADQRQKATAIRKEVLVRQFALIQKMREIDQRLEKLQLDVDDFKKALKKA